MKRAVRLLLYGALCLAATISAADRFSFSGSYTLTGTEGPRFEKGTVKKLRVVQSDASIEVTQTIDGHPYTNVYPFDGKEGIYVSPAGVKGTCKGQSKKNYDASGRQRPARPNSHQTEMGDVARPEDANHSLCRGLSTIRA